ncbi:spinster family MFS transporter [Sphingorhabdus arenilitoris]|uniref:Spinster family MFS transporter n=1 Tax=Sphingorhabdus arenilitoris TaxID=1490041 RepID=A0ABV8RHL6_9SPHN
MASSAEAAAGSTSTGQAFGTPGYRNYVLFTLLLCYTLNFIDRILIQVLSEPIINEFGLKDWQFGLLSGFGFALLYTIAGIPIARLAERMNRVKIIAISIVIWSLMTALCGLAGSFIALLAFRVGVGIGEAGLTPPANSIIADYFPPRSRARALAVYAMGVTLGSVLAAAFGGPIAQAFSWREAFLLLGIPGILVGVVVWFTIKEPPRGYSDPVGTPKVESRGFGETLGRLAGNRSYWLNVTAATIVAFVGYGVSSFQASFFVRAYDLSLAQVATQFLIPLGLAAAGGTFLGGFLTEKLSGRFGTAVAWLPGYGLILAVPFYWFGFGSSDPFIAFWLLFAAAILHYSYLGAQYTICQGVVGARSRATAIAIMLFVVNFIGYGAGPLVVGLLSDHYATAFLASSQFAGELTIPMCKGDGATLLQNLGATKAAFCSQMSAEGLRQSVKLVSLLFGVAGLVYLMTSKTLHKDMVAKMN